MGLETLNIIIEDSGAYLEDNYTEVFKLLIIIIVFDQSPRKTN